MRDYSNFPSYDFDIFSDEGILDPYPHYEAMRELSPVVHLNAANCLVVSRYKEVRQVLMDKARFVSGKGVALNDFNNNIAIGTTLMSDGERHSKLRSVLMRPLMPQEMAKLKDQIQQEADGVIERLIDKGTFNGVTDFSQYLPLTVVALLVGLPEEARANMLDWAAATFDGLGPMNQRMQDAMKVGQYIAQFLASITAENVLPGSWADKLFKAEANGEIDAQTRSLMLIDYTAPSLDTTIAASSQLLYHLGQNPDQWQALRDDPSLILNAVNEAVRIESPIRGFGRVANEDVEIEGVTIPKDSRILVMYASANRDDRYWENPETFNIHHDNLKRHMGFGFGVHQCAGQHLARLEMSSLLSAMIRRVKTIETSNPVYTPNNALRVMSGLDAKFAA